MPEKPNVLAVVTGGIGDIVSAEPPLRFALSRFKEDMDISLLTAWPWLFDHLRFKEVFVSQGGVQPDFSKYITRGTYPLASTKDQELANPLCSFNANGVDFASLQFLKWQLPFKDREIHLSGTKPERKHERYADPAIALEPTSVVIHPGASLLAGWKSKTFPVSWWKEMVECICRMGAVPVIIGQDSEVNGVAKIEGTGAIDLTNKLNIKELIYVLQRCKVLITNDSLPLHVAASCQPDGVSGESWIGYLATAKHPDFLKHYRHGRLGWRMHNMELGGVWSKPGIVTDAMSCTEAEMKSWLPQPGVVARWAVLAGRGEFDE